MPTPNPAAPFLCPICGSTSYRALCVRGPKGAIRQTELYECAGFSVVFHDPLRFRKPANVTPIR